MSTMPDGRGRFGDFGGRFVPETVMGALDELAAGYDAARADPTFAADLDRLGRDFVGRPSPLYLAERLGEASGLADVGAVVGATRPEHLARARELLPHAVFLLPGVGAQGGRVEDLGPAFAPGRAGGLVTASRSIVGAHAQHGGTPADAARAEAERLRALAWSLR
jgi:orotidine-5'-phosphate decarboxylase